MNRPVNINWPKRPNMTHQTPEGLSAWSVCMSQVIWDYSLPPISVGRDFLRRFNSQATPIRSTMPTSPRCRLL